MNGSPQDRRTPGEGTKPSSMPKTAIRRLTAIANERHRAVHPDIPEKWLPPQVYSDRTANGLTRCIIHWLRFNGHQAERINTTGRHIDQRRTVTDILGHQRVIGSTKWIPCTGTKGSADISSTIKGRSVKIEVKIGRDRQSDNQRRYQKDIEASGGVYFIATSFQQFHDWYMETFGK